MSKYQFCTGCEHRIEVVGEGQTCPSRFDPYDKECPRYRRFMELESKKRTGMATPRKTKPGW